MVLAFSTSSQITNFEPFPLVLWRFYPAHLALQPPLYLDFPIFSGPTIVAAVMFFERGMLLADLLLP
jgi:hypothetical protein